MRERKGTVDLQRDFLNYLQNSYLQKEVREKGISLGFLASVMDVNIEEYIRDMIKFAVKIGEFHCSACDNYYTANEAKVDEAGYLLCPCCNARLSAEWCDACGEEIDYSRPMAKKGDLIICGECREKEGIA